ncbi:predicted protein [Botrytis cinerea T4]|uniref:Uncharacterized protein n=1 Tax=Botryotinia fuckeliana (strain T4) TaxID=999810 RepID=G2Y4R8_BOTF4|nr:predicted protein [Botrytis cinerea T4]
MPRYQAELETWYLGPLKDVLLIRKSMVDLVVKPILTELTPLNLDDFWCIIPLFSSCIDDEGGSRANSPQLSTRSRLEDLQDAERPGGRAAPLNDPLSIRFQKPKGIFEGI